MLENISIIIPAFNAGQQLPNVLNQIFHILPGIDVIIVNDGSEDNTSEKALQFKEAICLHHPKNRGKGAALQTGIRYAIQSLNASALIFMDADGQHLPEDLPKLLEAYRKGEGNFIIGKRSFKKALMPMPRILSNKITSMLISLKVKQRIQDSQSGYRLVATDLLQRIKNLKSSGYEFETELLIKAAKAGGRFYEVPISTIYRNERSYIKPIRDIYNFIRVYLAT